ncbi:MAG: C4-dicarboxylate ABC transporter permease [Luteitalea sp.]|nr:C4-dicarboxylate ABC transporter permease [Luteitalea sp.]
MEGAFIQAVQQVFFSPYVWFVVIAAAIYGVFMGAVPGLTATMAVALLIPVVYFMDPVPALAALVTLTACAIFAGDIPNALLRIPGTPASAAYTEDAYRLTLLGKGDRVLAVCLISSVAGGLFGAVILILFAPSLAQLAARTFSVAEYFWLYLLGLSCAVIVSRGSMLRGLFALIIGLLLSLVGLSAVHAEARLTLGRPELYQGINFIPAMIGLFGVSEILRNMFAPRLGEQTADASELREPAERRRWFARPTDLLGISAMREASASLWTRKLHALRSSTIGAVIGMLPGAGADIGSWVSVAASKRFSSKPNEYGRGSMEGVSDGAAAKNAALAGAWVPALVFAIPGDSVTAIVIGVLLMKDVTPGPDIFTAQADIVYSIYLLFILANLVLIVAGTAAIRAGGLIRRTPKRVLLPIILLFCITGAYAINGSYFDVLVMGIMGFVGFLLDRRDISAGPVVLGIILGSPLEERFIQALTAADGSFLAFFSRPVAALLGVTALVLWLTPAIAWAMKRTRSGQEDRSLTS